MTHRIRFSRATDTASHLSRRTQEQRSLAHDAATEAWAETNHRSRTAGLAEMARGLNRRSRTITQRKAMQAAHKAKLQSIWLRSFKSARPSNPRDLDRSRYFPHQSDRECSRRVRQAAA